MQRQKIGSGGLAALVLGLSGLLSGCTSAPEAKVPVAQPRSVTVRSIRDLSDSVAPEISSAPIILGEELSGGIYIRDDVRVTVSDKHVHVYAASSSPGSEQLYSIELGPFEDSRDGIVVTPDSVGYLTHGNSVRLRVAGGDKHFFITGDSRLGVKVGDFRLVVSPAKDLAVVTYSGGVIANEGGAVDFSSDFNNNAGWNSDKFIALLNHVAGQENFGFGPQNPLRHEYPVDASKVRVDSDSLAGSLWNGGSLAIRAGYDFTIANGTVRRGGHEIVVGDSPVRVVSNEVYNSCLSGDNILVVDWRGCVPYNMHASVRVDGNDIGGSVVTSPLLKKP